MVLEVGARALTKHALNVHCGHDDVYGALDTGWIIVFGKDAQQAADQALILRRVTELSLTPGMNVMDGFLTSHLERTFYKHESELIREYLGAPEDIIDCPTESQRVLFGPTRRRVPKMIDLTNPVLLGPVQNQEHYMQGVVARRNNFTEPILDFLEDGLRGFRRADRPPLRPRSASTRPTMRTRCSCRSARRRRTSKRRSITCASTRGAKVGSIHINVFRPFPEAAIVKALAGKKNVIILERTDEPMAGDNPMGRDIRTALQQGAAGRGRAARASRPTQMPRLFGGVYGLGSRDFRPEHTIGAYEFAIGTARAQGRQARGRRRVVHRARRRSSVRGEVATTRRRCCPTGRSPSASTPSAAGARSRPARTSARSSATSTICSTSATRSSTSSATRRRSSTSARTRSTVRRRRARRPSYFMVAAPERIRVNCDLRHVNVVLCCDPKAFTHTNPLDGMSEGGCLVWESDEEGEQAWERLPLWARKQIIDKNIRVFTLPGFEIARKATDRGDLQLRMQGNAFLGAFFAVSPLLAGIRHHPGAVPRGRCTSST